MVGTWTPPGAIFTFAFDTDKLSLEMIKRTEIPQDEPISWMTFSVSTSASPQHDLPLTCASMTGKPSTAQQ
jgi:carboxy-cis,cis-muconate cyclase